MTITSTSKKSVKRFLASLFVVTAFSGSMVAQLSGTKNIPADYPTLAAAVADINLQGVNGPLVINVPAGFTETAPAGGYALTATGTAANTITFQKSGAGANPLLTAYTGTATPGSAAQDGVFRLVGSDYVTIDGIDITDPNTTNPATMEYGYALYKSGVADGAQFNTVKNCVITLNRVNNASGTSPMVDGSVGISIMNATPAAATTVLTPTGATGSNSNNKFYANTIKNCNIGIALIGYAAPSPFTLADTGNDIGGASAATGNTILNYGGAAGATNAAAAIRTLAQYGLNVSYNNINNNNGSGVNHVTTLRGIYLNTATSANATVSSNTVSVNGGGTTTNVNAIENASGSTAASNTISVINNVIQNVTYSTATTGIFNGILNSGTPAVLTITGNTINNVSLAGTGTSLLIETGSPAIAIASSNTITAISRSGASGSFRIIKTTSPGTSFTANNNLIDGVSWTAAGSTGSIDCIYSLSSATSVTANNNIIRNISTPSTGTLNGIREFGSSGNKTFQGNQIYNFSTTSGGAGGATFNGIYCSTGTMDISNNQVYALNSTGSTGGTAGTIYGIQITGGTLSNIYKNKIYNLSSTSTGPVISGLFYSGGTTNNAYNNLIGDLRATAASGVNVVIGINITGGTTDNMYYNSVYLSATSSGANFGTSAVFANTSPTTINFQNNIFINNSTATGAGVNVAFRRSSSGFANYGAASNNNLFYAGTPTATNVIFYDGTTAQQTLAAYKALAAPKDAASVTENVSFASTTGSSASFLHIANGTTTAAESGASNIATYTDDFDGDIRQGNAGYVGTGTSPDIGADEFQGITPAPVINSVAITPTGNQCTAASRNVTANVTAGASPLTSVTINYSFNGVAQTPITMTGGTTTGTSAWSGTIPVAVPANASVTWNVTATDGTYTKVTAGTSYADAPLLGVAAVASASANPVCSGSTATLTATFSGATPAAYTLPPAVSNPTTDEDLGGIVFGPLTNTTAINSLVGSIGTASGVAGSYSNFTAFGPYNFTAGNTYTFSVTALQQVTAYSNAMAIYIDYNRNGVFTDAGEAAYIEATTVSGGHTETGSITIPATAFNGLTRMRVIVNEGGIISSPTTVVGYGEYEEYMLNISSPNIGGGTVPAFSSYSWSDGTTTVGTTNPLNVNPTATANYSITATDANGCTVTSAPVTLTVTPLPSAPTVTNSSQCGVGTPTAQVGGGTSYNWYATATSTTVLQSGTGTTYTSSIGTTTTFYVSSLSGICESPRSAVTASVTLPDGVTASISSANLCPAGAATLTATQSGSTNAYVFTWTASPAAGSGIPTSVAGRTVAINPTLAGTYVYSVTASDGVCTTISTVSATVNPTPGTPSVTPTSSVTICLGSSQVITGVSFSPVLANIFNETYETFPFTQFTNTGTGVTVSQNSTYFQQGANSAMLTYATSASGQFAETASINLSTYGNPTLSFYQICATEAGYDYGYVQYSTDGGTTWNSFPTSSYTGAGTLKNGVVSFDKSSYASWGTQFTSSTSTPGTGPATALWQLETINLAAYQSSTQFKVRFNLTSDGSVNYYGWLIDNVNITGQSPSNISWASSPNSGLPGSAATPSSANTSLTVTPTAAGAYVYTATATSAAGCVSASAATSTLFVNPLPSAPTATNSSQCGVGVPAAQVGGGTSYNWYATPTATSAIQSGTSNTYTTSINSTTTFYVTSVSGICESPRTTITASVTIPDGVIAATSSASLCPSGSATLTATQTGTNNPYIYTWTASPSAGSGIPTSVSGATTVVTPTLPGTYTYSVTATDGICTTIAGVNVTLNNTPLAPAVTPSANVSFCLGGSQTITAVAGTNLLFAEPFEVWPLGQFTTTGTNVLAAQNTTYYQQGTSSALLTYSASADGQLAMTSDVNLSTFANPKLTFYQICGTEAGYDYGYIQYSTDAGATWTSFPTSSYLGSGTLKNGVVSFDKSSYASWNTQFSASTSTPGTGPATALWQLETIDLTAYQSNTQFRVRFRLTSDGSVNYYGWLIDRMRISAQVPATFAWTSSANSGLPGSAGTASAANGTLVVTPTAPGAYVYTATATNAGGCVSSAAITATVTVNALPSAPTATNSTQCGLGVPTAAVGGSTSYIWYGTPTSTVALQSGTPNTYTTAISTSTTFYVSSYNGTCESGSRTAVTVTVTTPDAVTAVATPSVLCPGQSSVLMANQTGSTNVYSFTWTATPAAGSGIPTSVTGHSVSVLPTLAGTYVYTVTASDGLCTTTSTANLTVNAAPNISNVSATPSVVCSGATVNLNATSINGAAGSATVGVQNTTSITGGPFRSGAGSDNKAQYVFTAAELNAAGVQAGNITALSFNVTSLGSGVMPNWTLKIGTTTASNLTTTFDASPLATVYGPVAYTAVSGPNTFTFATPFNWNGVSNIIVQVCHDAVSSGSSSVDMASVPNTAIYTLVTGACSQTTGTSNTPYRPVIVFNGIVGTNVASSINWMWNPGAIPSNTATVNPVNTGTAAVTQNYTITATDPVTTCTNSAVTSVTVNPLPAAPSAFNSVQCGVGVPTASVSGGTSYIWYSSPTSTTVLQSGTSQTYTTSISSSTTFYVSSFNGTCEGPRSAVTVTVNVPDAITASVSSASICPNTTATLSVSQTGSTNTYSYTWTASPAAGSGIPTSAPGVSVVITPSLSGVYVYTVTGVDGLCTAVSTVTLNVFQAITTPPTVAAVPNPVCAGNTVTLTGTFSGTAIPVYAAPPAVTSPTTDEDLGHVSFGPLNNTTAINSLVGTIGTASGTAGSYSDFTAFGPYNVTAGNTYALSVDVLQQVTAYQNAIGVYIDFNRNGVFTDPGEAVYVSPGTTAGAHTETAFVTIPANAQSGRTHMRVLVNEGTVTGPTMAVSYGEYEEYMLNIQPNVTYSWSDGTSTIGTTNPLVVTPAGNTTYSFSVVDPNGCSISSTGTTVSVTPIPTVTAVSSATAVCAGSPATLTASGATSYIWTPGNVTTSTVVVNPTVNTTYTVTGSTTGCTATATVALVATPLPTVTATASNSIICAGNTITITATGANNYTWTPGAQTTASISVTPTVTTNYTVSGTDATGCAGTGTVHIVVNNVPTLSVTPASTTICSGGTVTLTGSGATSYSWSSGSTTNTAVVTPTASTTYTLSGTNFCGTSTITAMVSTVTNPTVTAVASSSLVCAGSSATITASGAATYSWTPGGATTTTIVVTPTANVTYTVRGTNACGTASTVTTVSLSPTPTVTAVSTRTSICAGDFAVLTASGAASYTWTPGGATTSSITVTPTVTTAYSVTGKTAAGCTATATVNQLVLPCTGIEEVSVSGIDMYPNPNLGSVNVTVPDYLIGHSTIQVYDAIGKLVIRENLTDATTHLNTSRLEEGLYIYKIFNNDGVVVKIGRMVRNK